MSILEICAMIFTVVCVFLAVKRSTWQYPVGIVGTILYFFVFLDVKLYASAGLQVFFTAVQVYGWWYWLVGFKGTKPPITSWSAPWIGLTVVAGVIIGGVLAGGLNTFTDAKVPFWDALIFGLSMAAQFLLDRKKVENWIVWGFVNILAVFVYGSQGLMPTAILYGGLFLNAFWGYYEWRKAHRAQRIVWEDEAEKFPPAPEVRATPEELRP